MISKRSKRTFGVAGRVAKGSLGSVLALLGFCLFCFAAQAPTQLAFPMRTSDLGRENLSCVVASALDIRVMLRKDPGVMLELKRWVAKDATDGVQIVSNSELTDDAAFQRLKTDGQFHSVATRLLERHGYLAAKLQADAETEAGEVS